MDRPPRAWILSQVQASKIQRHLQAENLAGAPQTLSHLART